MKVGDHVKVLGVPPKYLEDTDPEVVEVFRRSIGNVYPIHSFYGDDYVQLEVGKILGTDSYHSIWLAMEFVEPA